MIISLFQNIAIRKTWKKCHARRCLGSNTICQYTFFRFPSNPERAQRLGKPCKAEHTRKLQTQYVCSQHFSETDFTSVDKTRLNNMAVPNPCTVMAHLHSAAFSEVSSSSSSSSEENCNVLIPTRTYSRLSHILVTEEPVQVQSHTSSPSVISPDLSQPAETSTFSSGHLVSTWL